MTDIHIPQDLDIVFEALANKHRRDIIYVLGLQPCSISFLADMRGLSLPAIYKHIKILEDADMIIRKKMGRTNYLTLNRNSLLSVMNGTSDLCRPTPKPSNQSASSMRMSCAPSQRVNFPRGNKFSRPEVIVMK